MSLGTTKSRTTMSLVAAAIALVMLLVAGGSAATTAQSVTASRGTVAKSPLGTLKSTIAGKAADGRTVSGTFTPLRFVKRDGRLKVKGVIDGVVKSADGSRETFTVVRTMKVKKINGQRLVGLTRQAAGADLGSAAACNILSLVLGPLHLDLLGLVVDLNRVVLNITAVAGAGNLLGNLLCAVAGLLDGGPLAGLLGQLNNLLNQILAILNLGL